MYIRIWGAFGQLNMKYSLKKNCNFTSNVSAFLLPNNKRKLVKVLQEEIQEKLCPDYIIYFHKILNKNYKVSSVITIL